jgi:hypothetical protein
VRGTNGPGLPAEGATPTHPLTDMYDRCDVARLCGLRPNTVTAYTSRTRRRLAAGEPMTDELFPLPIKVGRTAWWVPADIERYLRHRRARTRPEVWEHARGDQLARGDVIRNGSELWHVRRKERDPTAPGDVLVQVSKRKGAKSGQWRRVRAGRTVERLRGGG